MHVSLVLQPLSFKRQDPPMRGGYSAQNGVGAGAARRSGTAPPQSSQVEHAAVAPRVESASQRRLDMESVTSSGTYASRVCGCGCGCGCGCWCGSCHRAVPSTPSFEVGESVLCACPYRKALLGIEHALSCLTVQLTRILIFGPGVELVCLFATVWVGVGVHVRVGVRVRVGACACTACVCVCGCVRARVCVCVLQELQVVEMVLPRGLKFIESIACQFS